MPPKMPFVRPSRRTSRTLKVIRGRAYWYRNCALPPIGACWPAIVQERAGLSQGSPCTEPCRLRFSGQSIGRRATCNGQCQAAQARDRACRRACARCKRPDHRRRSRATRHARRLGAPRLATPQFEGLPHTDFRDRHLAPSSSCCSGAPAPAGMRPASDSGA